MTAQAGAVECDECGMMCSPNEYHPYAACLMFKGCQRGDIVRANLTTPPAAVSVEALEGLAAEWEAEAAALLGKSKRAANHVAAASLNTRAAQLRKLIKERSK